MNIPAHDQKTINSFIRAYAKKQKALKVIKENQNAIAQHMGYTDYNQISERHKDTPSIWDAFRHTALRYPEKFGTYFTAQCDLINANRMLKKTKYTYWYYHTEAPIV